LPLCTKGDDWWLLKYEPGCAGSSYFVCEERAVIVDVKAEKVFGDYLWRQWIDCHHKDCRDVKPEKPLWKWGADSLTVDDEVEGKVKLYYKGKKK
jgi:hypothetical protein